MTCILDFEQSGVFHPNNLRTQPVHTFSNHALDALSTSLQSPQHCAVEFYTLNHLTSVVKDNIAHDADLGMYLPIYKKYHSFVVQTGLKMLYYMLCICVRESRHLNNPNTTLQAMPVYDLWSVIKGHGGTPSVKKFLNQTSKGNDFDSLTMGELVDYLQEVFYKHSWSSSFGGKAWGNITDQVASFISGELSLEMLVDIAFTLSHNTGSIFNKGFIFTTDYNFLTLILDVQRSGQMPEYVLSSQDHGNTSSINKELRPLVKLVEGISNFKDGVNWQQVEDLGSINSYPKKIKDQTPITTKESEEDHEIDLAPVKEMVTIFPGLTLNKTTNTRVKEPKTLGGLTALDDTLTTQTTEITWGT